MNRGELETQLQVTGFGTSSGEINSQREWLRSGYGWLWSQADWEFKKIELETLAVVAGDSTPTMPTYAGRIRHLLNSDGDPLVRMDERDFDVSYQGGVIDSARGVPEAYKVAGRVITLGPVPSAAATFYVSHDARAYHYDSTGVTRDGGYMDADTDIPAWGFPDGDHHMILVYHAAMVGHGMRSNPMAVTMQGLRDDALESMIEEFVRDTSGNTQYGRTEA